MSLTSALSQGEYDKLYPISFISSIKTNLAGFQCTAFASGLIATPASPMAPDLESGEINKKGTAEVIVFIPELPFNV